MKNERSGAGRTSSEQLPEPIPISSDETAEPVALASTATGITVELEFEVSLLELSYKVLAAV